MKEAHHLDHKQVFRMPDWMFKKDFILERRLKLTMKYPAEFLFPSLKSSSERIASELSKKDFGEQKDE